MNILQRMVVAAICRYQASGGGRELFRVDCNFEPSCSEYTKQAVVRFGVVRGVRLASRRLQRCNKRDCISIEQDPVPARECSHV